MKSSAYWLFVTILLIFSTNADSQYHNLYTSADELADVPMSGLAWEQLLKAADEANPAKATVSDQDSNNNTHILASAIVYARTGIEKYKNKVISACENLVAHGRPSGTTLAWGRETGAYVCAADLVGYRTPEFEQWLQNMTTVWQTEGKTLRSTFDYKPNNWGTAAFASLVCIYAYLGDTLSLKTIRKRWISYIEGPAPPGMKFKLVEEWQADPNDPRQINPVGSVKQGLDISGVQPEEQRRVDKKFTTTPHYTNYHWTALTGTITAAWVLDRLGMPIWSVGDSAIYRAAYKYQVEWHNQFQDDFWARGDDLCLLPFLDYAYGTDWTREENHNPGEEWRVWDHHKIAGFGYVTLGRKKKTNVQAKPIVATPGHPMLAQNYPNPFNATTTISYFIPHASQVKLDVYDLTGKRTKNLIDAFKSAGWHTLKWDGKNDQNVDISSGVYVISLVTGRMHYSKKVILIK